MDLVLHYCVSVKNNCYVGCAQPTFVLWRTILEHKLWQVGDRRKSLTNFNAQVNGVELDAEKLNSADTDSETPKCPRCKLYS